MPIAINEVEALKEYLNGVMSRAAHHGPGVSAIGLALAGAIIWRKDLEPIQVHEGRTMAHGNVLWVQINGQRYAFRYNHQTEAIEMRRGSVRGEALHCFNDDTPITEVERIFREL